MKTRQCVFVRGGVMACSILLLSWGWLHAQKSQYACSELDPQSICNASNTCGSRSNPCIVDVKRTNEGASATPGIPDAKGNETFCVKSGTTIIWKSTQRNTGFIVDFGPSSPFGSDDAISGGAKRPASVVAKKAGCYKFSTGACISGEIQGMCGTGQAEAVVIAAGSH